MCWPRKRLYSPCGSQGLGIAGCPLTHQIWTLRTYVLSLFAVDSYSQAVCSGHPSRQDLSSFSFSPILFVIYLFDVDKSAVKISFCSTSENDVFWVLGCVLSVQMFVDQLIPALLLLCCRGCLAPAHPWVFVLTAG